MLALLAAVTPPVARAHGDLPDADVACTGRLLLNDDLAPSAAGRHAVVSARAEIVAADGTAVGTYYLDDRGAAYLALELGASAPAKTAFGAPGARPDRSGTPHPLGAHFVLPAGYRLAACR